MNKPLLSDPMRSAQVLADSEDYDRTTFDRAGFGITHMDADGVRLSVNRTFCELLGYTEQAFLALPFDALLHPDDADEVRLARDKVLRGELKASTIERRYRCHDGRWIWGQVTTTAVERSGGRPACTIAIMRDITARRIAEDALRASEERFRATFEQAPFAIAHSSPDGTWLRVNRRFVEMFGYREDELAAVTWRDLNHPDELAARERNMHRLASGEAGTITREKRYLRRGGVEFWGQVTLSAVRMPDGSMDYLVASIEDISERRRAADDMREREAENRLLAEIVAQSPDAIITRDLTSRLETEQALRESEARNRLLAGVVDQTSEAIITKDLDNRVLTWNRGATALFGYAAEEAIGRNISTLVIPGADPERIAAAVADTRACRTHSRFEARRARNGRTFDVEVSYSPLYSAEGAHIGEISIARDITSRLAAERALRSSEARSRLLAAVVEQSAEAIVIKDLDNIILSWNAGAERMYGWSQAEAVGRNITLLVWPAASGADVARRIARLRGGEPEAWRTVSHRRDGSRIHVDVNVSPLFDENGRHIGEITMMRDITERERAESALRATEARNRELALIVDQSYDAIITKDTANRILTWNRGAERIFGWPAGEVLGRDFLALMKPDAGQAELRAAIERIGQRKSETWETVRITQSGPPIHVEVTVSPLFDDDGRHLGEISINRDITARVQAEEALRDHQLFLEQAQEVGGIGSWALSLANGRLTWSDETVRIFGLDRGTFDGRQETFESLVHPDDVERVRVANEQALAARAPYTNEFRILRPDGTQRWIFEHAAIICDDENRPLRVVGVAQDITERRAAQERIEFLATRDPLTELPNRLLLSDRITHGMASAARNGTQLALLFIDLDHFKTINDSLGHRVGDELLKQVAERLARCVRMEDTLARLGGDEFVVLLQGLGDSQVASQVARKVLKLVARPYLIEGHQLSTSCSIGISLYPTDGTDSQALMKNADAAMYHAKERGRGNYQYFSADLHSRAVERLSIETALRRALERDEFELYFQPQVRMSDSKMVGMEALLRWNHPEEGRLAPGRFIRIAEESGLIVPLGEWALDAACARMRAWLDAGLHPPRLAVNVSVGQLSRSFVRSVGRILQAHRIDGSQLELEMTESLLMQQVDENVKLLQRLTDLGVQVALDDFGTGYSSLAYLKKFPIDALKIDRTFVRDIVDDPDDSAITAAVVSIGHHMQLRVVAEGVETAEQLAILQSMGCDEYQGYLFSRPLAVQAFAARFLAAEPATPPAATDQRVSS